jgi:hypothetical protein
MKTTMKNIKKAPRRKLAGDNYFNRNRSKALASLKECKRIEAKRIASGHWKWVPIQFGFALRDIRKMEVKYKDVSD